MMLGAYRTATCLAGPVLRGMVKNRAARGKEDKARLAERFGIPSLDRPAGRLIWFHAASVGETMSILPVIHACAGANILLTTGTLTSARLAAERLSGDARHQFIPLDHPAWTERFLRHWRPDAAVFVESELWPNLLDGCDSAGIPRLLINARISARSAANWRRAGPLARRVLGPFRYIHAQSPADADNLRALGLKDILEWGNLKFFAPALPAEPGAVAAWRRTLPEQHWLAASTHPGEEQIILAAHKVLLGSFPGLVTIIVPRHPERGAELATALSATRRSLGELPVPGHIHLADTLGELGLFYRAAPFAFIGNSLIGFGGHNLIEPAMLGCPVLTGPHVENFLEAACLLREAGALREVTDPGTLAAAVADWLNNSPAISTEIFPPGDLPARLASLILDCALA